MRNIRKRKTVERNNDTDNLPKKMGDMFSNAFVVMVAALFAEFVVKGEASEYVAQGALAASAVFIFAVFMYKRGGL
ncbi:MAG: hypothetical protein FWE23_08340 [Chitinivibrionia bacterium]|jgi:hypothetical protein|nr:hypothetical protein [Chitinivibrionia bacterium]